MKSALQNKKREERLAGLEKKRLERGNPQLRKKAGIGSKRQPSSPPPADKVVAHKTVADAQIDSSPASKQTIPPHLLRDCLEISPEAIQRFEAECMTLDSN